MKVPNCNCIGQKSKKKKKKRNCPKNLDSWLKGHMNDFESFYTCPKENLISCEPKGS